jgi:protein TonB
VEFSPIDDVLAATPRRTGIALAVSAAAHAVVFALALLTLARRPPGETTPIVVFPISLVSAPGGGGGDGSAAPAPEPPEPPPPAPNEQTAAPAEPAPPPPAIARPKPNVKPKPAARSATSTASVPGDHAEPAPSGGDATRDGDGSGGTAGGGRGIASATAQYGTNPEPPYPIAARRLGLEGTVILRVVVAPDGSPREVSVLRSSGHDVLDESAASTVRSRWRFLPARRDGVPIEDSVQVPIRFHRTQG